MRRPVRIVILATNLLVIVMCVRFAIFVIWFAQYKDRMVGPSVTYAFYALLAVVVAQGKVTGVVGSGDVDVDELRFRVGTST